MLKPLPWRIQANL